MLNDLLLLVLVSSTLTIQMVISLINMISIFNDLHKLYTEKRNYNITDHHIILEKLSYFDSLIEDWLIQIKQKQEEQNQEKKQSNLDR